MGISQGIFCRHDGNGNGHPDDGEMSPWMPIPALSPDTDARPGTTGSNAYMVNIAQSKLPVAQ